jgi:phosphoglycolate phosphatase
VNGPAGGGSVRHVAFDLDGTLIDSRSDLASAVNHVRARCGAPPIDPRTVYAYVGDGARALLERAVGPLPEAAMDEALAWFLAHYGAHCLDRTRLYPGMGAVLETLRSGGHTLSVVTNKPAHLSERILSGLGIRAHFLAVVGGDSLPTRKPDPDGLLYVAGLAGTTPSETLLVGDSPVDLETASAAGTRFCGVAWGFVPERLMARRPRCIVRGAPHLLDVIDRGDDGDTSTPVEGAATLPDRG